ncbi:putative post-transcriptional gene silencing PAZ-Argonaute family [Rosa chinensis]|uniref:Putative post-transcriptional gene silencing PAZ-Argonaute family n=1 Tax=Rosa chinensis TaxID=74649 RepID=A0A2P6QGK4_ROSCH|nr:protein argonaute 5 isoform X2 [Rosa chinensis]PRQ33301.1 putative post-transcriptional gene silencing PAZ-Argonaute family [Rosa chinensis]
MSGRGSRGRHYSGGRSNPSHGGGGRGSFSGGGSSGAAAPAPTQTRAYFPPAASSSSAPVASLSSEMEQKLTLETTTTAAVAAVPPASSKAVRFPQRPGFGTVGKKIQVRANHFLVQVADRDLHHYDVTITPEVASKKIHREVMNQLVRLYSETHLGKRIPAYDGMKSLYTAGPLPFSSKEFVVKLLPNDGRAAAAGSSTSSKRKDREFKVALTLANKPDLYQLQQFLHSQRVETPQEAIQVLDIVLRATPSEKYTVVGRSFFSTELGPKGSLGEGLEYWRGFYQSLRPTQLGLSLNIDVSARSFFEPILVTEFLAKHFYHTDRSKHLPDRDCIKVKKTLKRVKVEVRLRDWTKNEEVKRTYTINGLSAEPLGQLRFTCEDENTSVVQYYRKKYKIDLKYVAWPAIQAGNDSKPVYLPMELCSIVAGQRYTKKLNKKQVTNLLKATCQRPRDRENNITQMIREKTNNRDDKESLIRREFGLQVREEMSLVKARVLPSPLLKYHDSGREKSVYPQMGQWNMTNKKMVNGGRLQVWAFVNFSRVSQDITFEFLGALVDVCNSKGMEFFPQPLLPVQFSHPGQIERVLRDIHKLSAQQGRQLQLLIVILPDQSDSSYGKIKRTCETELGIVSQCLEPQKIKRWNTQYLENLALKINVKVGGRNTVLNDAIYKKMPVVTDRLPTIIFGADVTHPAAGDDSSPSIAAVVASTDWPEVTNYRAIVSAQHHRDEIIKDLYKSQISEKGLVHGGMIRELLVAFYKQKRLKPSRIIFYRDGVSEGQFSQVLLHEVDAIRRACASLEDGYMPTVTFVVVQKRHHTRLFPADHSNRGQMDRSGNIQPGTVVDTEICHPTEFDFYLNSHAGIQGTSRPAHYHVLFDENRFTADGLQVLTNNLCYTYARCTRSVSIVPPAYYAHLVAFRARHYIEGDSSDGGSTTGGGAQVFRALPEIKENVKEVMFYC